MVCDPKLILQISGTFQQSCRKLHRKTEEADNAVKVVLSKLSSCCDELGKMDLDDSTIENMSNDMAASMEAVERHEVEISAYQANIRTTSHDMLLLYSGSRDIEVGPLLLKLQHIFWLPKLSASPAIVERTSEDLDGMLDVFVKRVVTRSRGPSNPSFGTGNPHFGPPVFRKCTCTVQLHFANVIFSHFAHDFRCAQGVNRLGTTIIDKTPSPKTGSPRS